MIGIVNYGVGNVQAIANIYHRLNIPLVIASSPAQLLAADNIVLPGVGAFDWAMSRLNQSGMRDTLDECVLGRKKPILGICVGMQMMANRSEEGELSGLGWIDANILKFGPDRSGHGAHLPHMGWNDIHVARSHALLAGLETAAQFYFLHSYFFAPNNSSDVLASTDYSGPYASAIAGGVNILGVQFHPEKSHKWGIQLLENFARIA